MVQFRTYRNTDPPALVRLWNEILPGPSAVRIRSPIYLDFFALSKPYFDPRGLILAVDRGRPVGFALANFGPSPTQTSLDYSTGILCFLGVVPSHRGQGIGTQLLQRAEAWMREQGARTILAGPRAPLNPFGLGLYGGSQSPGLLSSEASLGQFLLHRGYEVAGITHILRRHLHRPFSISDERFPALRKKYDVRQWYQQAGSWYQEGIYGLIEMQEFHLEDRSSGVPVGRALAWEMDLFSQRWNEQAVGLVHVHIEEPLRRQGLGRLLTYHVMRYFHDQYFTLVEAQVGAENPAGLALLRGLGFEDHDLGRAYRKKTTNQE